MSYRLRPAKLINGFIHRLKNPKFEQDRLMYEGDLERWLKQRGIIQQEKINTNGKGFISLATINTWLAIPLPTGKVDIEPYIGDQLRDLVQFAVKHDCDMFVVE